MKYSFSIVLFSFWIIAFGQNSTMHLDKPYYFSGDYIFYSFCNLNLPDDTILARIELSDSKELIDHYYLEVHHRCGDGYIKLPFDLESNVYSIQVQLVTENLFEIIELTSIEIPIYNDEDLPNLVDKVSHVNLAHEPIKYMDTLLHTHTSTPQIVKIALDLPPALQNQVHRISVSVRDQTLFQEHLKTIYQQKKALSVNTYLRGIPVFGTRKTDNANSINNPLLFSFNPAIMHFGGAKVNSSNGQFSLTISPFYNKKPLCFLDYVGNDITISERQVFIRPDIQSDLEVDSTIIDHLKIFREEKQINRLFKQIVISPIEDSTQVIKRTAKPDSYVDVQDYAIRGTSVDLFKEITTNLKFRSAGGSNYKARMLYEFNGITKFYSRAPLFIINGRATRDGDFIAKLPLQEIGYFRIFSDYEFLESLSPMAHGGIVYIDMLDQNYVLPDVHTLPTLSVQGLQRPIYYPIRPSFIEGSPAISSLLFWNPDQSAKNGSIEIELTTADISTEYLMDAVIYLKNGETRSLRKKIRIAL